MNSLCPQTVETSKYIFLTAKVRYTPVFSKMALHGGGHLDLKKMHKGDFWGSSEFVRGDVHVSFLKKAAFCNLIPGSTLMLLHYHW